MKTLITFLIFNLSLLIFNSNAQWMELDPGVDDALLDIYAITPDIVIAVGANGTIIKTIDGGETWQQKISGTTTTLMKVQFPTNNIGYISALNTFLKTTDGGETWFPINVEQDCFYYNLSCVDANLIFVTCNGNLMKSIDGGENWIEMGVIPSEKLQYLSNDVGYFIGSQGFFKTENGGETWMELNFIGNPFQFLNENTGFFYLEGLFKTNDGGYNFERLGYGEGWDFSSMFVVNESTTWGILNGLFDGDGSTRGIVKVHILEDGTYTEDIWYDGDSGIDMARIHFADEHTGYIVGYKYGNPTIWKNNTGTNTMSTNEPTVTQEIKIYPNPASEVLNIDFGKTISDINIVLSDITGKQLFSEKYKDKSKISVNTKTLSKGVYILSVYTGSQKFTKKIIIN